MQPTVRHDSLGLPALGHVRRLAAWATRNYLFSIPSSWQETTWSSATGTRPLRLIVQQGQESCRGAAWR